MDDWFLYGYALGVSSGLAIGLIVLAAYHTHVSREIRRAEEDWALDREAVHGHVVYDDGEIVVKEYPDAWGFGSGDLTRQVLANHNTTTDEVLNLSPEQWKRQQNPAKRGK